METTRLFLGCEMRSEKDQAIAPSHEVLQQKMCLDTTVFSPDDGSVLQKRPGLPSSPSMAPSLKLAKASPRGSVFSL